MNEFDIFDDDEPEDEPPPAAPAPPPPTPQPQRIEAAPMSDDLHDPEFEVGREISAMMALRRTDPRAYASDATQNKLKELIGRQELMAEEKANPPADGAQAEPLEIPPENPAVLAAIEADLRAIEGLRRTNPKEYRAEGTQIRLMALLEEREGHRLLYGK